MSMPATQIEATEEALRVEGIKKSIGGLDILTDVSFSVAKGERRGIIGPNGAGKTTLFNIISGEIAPTGGAIYCFGDDVTKLTNDKRVAKGIAKTFQRNNLFGELTVLDNILLVLQKRERVENVWFKRRSRKNYAHMYEEAEHLIESFGISEQKNNIVNELSYGDQRQIEIILGVATNPRILMLDEPTAGMSNKETQQILKLLKTLPSDLTIVIIEHDMDVLFEITDRISVLNNGSIIVEGPPETIKTDQRVFEVYFGKGTF